MLNVEIYFASTVNQDFGISVLDFDIWHGFCTGNGFWL